MPDTARPTLAEILRNPSLLGPDEGHDERVAAYFKTATKDDVFAIINNSDAVIKGLPDGRKFVAKAFAEATSSFALYLSDPRLLAFTKDPANAFEFVQKSMDNGYYPPVIDSLRYFLTAEKGALRGRPEVASIIGLLADSDGSHYLLDHIEEFRPFHDIKGAPEAIQRVLAKEAAQHPEIFLYSADRLQGIENSAAYIEQAYKAVMASPVKSDVFYNIPRYPDEIKSQPWFEKSLMDMEGGAANALLFHYSSALDGQPYAKSVREKAVNAAIAGGAGNALYFDRDSKYYKALAQAAAASPAYSAAFPEIVRQATHAKASAELVVRRMNVRHELPAAQRFDELKFLDHPSQHFDLLTYGRAEAFTSSYNGILDDMLGRMKTDGLTLRDVVGPGQMPRMAAFLEAASSYNRLGDVMKFVPEGEVPGLAKDMAAQVAGSTNMSYVVALTDMMKSVKGDSPLRQELERTVVHHFEHAASPEEKAKFGLIASAYYRGADRITPDMKASIEKIATDPAYALPSLDRLNKNLLVDRKGVNNQLMIFSGDEDGDASFDNFKKTYAGKAGWKIENKGTYVHIHSTGGKVPVHIYANDPHQQAKGLENIKAVVAAQQGTPQPQFQVFIGRGHSYHSQDYLKELAPGNNLVFLGSCGGYQNVAKVLETSPEAHVIATQGTGSMTVNDPMLFHINSTINSGRDVVWGEERKYLDTLPSKYRNDYMLPDKNDGLLIQKKFAGLVPDVVAREQAQMNQQVAMQFRPVAPNRRGLNNAVTEQAERRDETGNQGPASGNVASAEDDQTRPRAEQPAALPQSASAPDRRSIGAENSRVATPTPATPQGQTPAAASIRPAAQVAPAAMPE